MKTIFLAILLAAFLVGNATAQPPDDTAILREAHRQTERIRAGGRDWPTHETRFFRIRHQDPRPPSTLACAELDRFTARTAARVGLDEQALAGLESTKLDYYLCDDETMQQVTGFATKGMADLRGRAIISSHFPHFHELAHLLADMMFDETPMQTLPVVQEGLACLLGGRWGRAPEVILYTGWVNDSFGMGELDEVLTLQRWSTFKAGTDVAYPLGALLCETVRRKAGWEGVMELNRRVAGSADFVAGLDEVAIMGIIGEIGRWGSPQQFQAAFDQVVADHRRCGLEPAKVQPAHAPEKALISEEGEVMVWAHTGMRVWAVSAPTYPVFILSRAGETDAAASPLFKDHLPGHTYAGQRYGMRVSPDNISLYDFGTNQLIGLWIMGFTNETDGLDVPDGSLVFGDMVQDSRAWQPAALVLP